jgi:hypothetical protein
MILGGFGLILGLVMLYPLVFDETRVGQAPDVSGAAEVAVCYRERSEWRIFARGARLCVEGSHPLGTLVKEEDDAILVETSQHQRLVRFTWRGVRGESQARLVVQESLTGRSPPIAIVGSSNTVLTEAIAGQLRTESREHGGAGPLLLIPWATSVSLLGVYPGRTFRFCSNNRREAELLIDCLKARPEVPGPRRVIMVVDPLDPYSVDLAACFETEVHRAFPKAEVTRADEKTSTLRPRLSARSGLPTVAEQSRARGIWRDFAEGPGGETWVFLPLQNDPARRMLVALNGAAPGRHAPEGRRLTVVCGDAVGATTLHEFVNQFVFPVWSVTTASDPSTRGGLEEDVHEQAEVVAAILIGLDRPGEPLTPDSLRATLVRPPLDAPAPFGRPLAFTAEGERAGFDPGGTFQLRPDSPRVDFYPTGHWSTPRPVESADAP